MGLGTVHCGMRLHLNRIGDYNDTPACRKCGLNDDSAEHVLFDLNGLKQERAASHGKLVKGCRVPEEGLVLGIRRLSVLSGLLM